MAFDSIPDAPYIREAEMYGMPSPDPVHCPVCGKECEEIYKDKDGDVVGCEHCVQSEDAYQWWEWNKPDDRPEDD